MLSLRTKLVLTLLLVSVGSVSSFGWMSFHLAQKQLIELRGEELRALVLNQKRDLKNTVVGWEDRARLIASRTQLRKRFASHLESPQPEHLEKMRRILTDALGSTRQVASITLCDPTGTEVVSVRKKGALHGGCGTSPDRIVSRYGLQDIWEESGQMRILVRTPLLDDERLVLGDALVILGATELLEVLGNVVGLGATGETLMVREAPPNQVQIFATFRHRSGPGPLTQLYPFEKSGLPVRFALEGKEQYFSDASVQDYRGEAVLAASAPIPELGWGLVAKIDRDEALAPAADFRTRTIYLSLSVALAALALGAVLNRHISQPLAQLSGVARRVSGGQQNVRVRLERSDEFGELGRAFDAMLDRLAAGQEERSRLIANLTMLNTRLEDFAHIAAHDLRAPLRHVRKLTDWLSEDLKDQVGGESVRKLTLLGTRVERLEQLLEDLLAYAKSGREQSEVEVVDLQELSEEVFSLVKGDDAAELIWSGKNATLRTHKAPLALVLRNLVGNAMKHNEGQRLTITVSARLNRDWCQLSVADDGRGIPEADSERIFEAFQTLETKDESEGSGVGLSLVRKTVESYGGTVSHRQNTPKGCLFVFSWPLNVEGAANGNDGVAPTQAA